jgi:hypothetical protein
MSLISSIELNDERGTLGDEQKAFQFRVHRSAFIVSSCVLRLKILLVRALGPAPEAPMTDCLFAISDLVRSDR